MLIVPIKEGETVDKALKKLKKKFEKAGILKELRERQMYVKPSVKRRNEVIRAIYRQKLKQLEE
jgi:small subunit ribosomal protein S21